MLEENFKRIPRIPLAPLFTPVERMDRLAASIKGAPELYIKRDDFIGQLVWGNKLRKLEYTLAKARAQGADTVITCGAVQSNHARTTAQVAKRVGFDCILVLNGEEPGTATGNYRIVKLMGVRVVLVKNRDERKPAMESLADSLIKSGKKPFLIPLGASDETGTAGFAGAMGELREQMKIMSTFFTHIYHSTSSGGTQAGMEAGKIIFGLEGLKITGISADDSVNDITAKVLGCANPFLSSLGSEKLLCVNDVNVSAAFTGPGYGIPSESTLWAKKLFLEHEGILLDDTYTAKAADGLLTHCEEGMFTKNDKVLFWHTGGLINLF